MHLRNGLIWFACLVWLGSCRYDARPHPAFMLTVINGEGSGEHEAGAVVAVQAVPPQPGLEFLYWSGDSTWLDDPRAPRSNLLMPEQDLRVVARFADTTRYPLTVQNGLGSGRYLGGTEVPISAAAAERGFRFAGWLGDTAYLSAVGDSLTTLLMPYATATIVAQYAPLPRYSLTVEDGQGSGDYLAGDSVWIEAQPAAPGESFAGWAGDTAWLVDPSAPETWVIMPAEAISLRARYESATFSLTVLHGSGSGAYAPGTRVQVQADPAPPGQRFIRWGEAADLLLNFQSPSTIAVMPTEAATVAALYRADTLPLVSYALDIQPIFARSCLPGCHASGSNYSDLSDHPGVFAYRDEIKTFVQSGTMPPGSPLDAFEVTLIVQWINAGAADN